MRLLLCSSLPLALTLSFFPAAAARSQSPPEVPAPILDVHLHAMAADGNGPPGTSICAPFEDLPAHDPSRPWPVEFLEALNGAPCANRLPGAMTDEEAMRQTFEILERRNVYAITSGVPRSLLETWRQADEAGRILPGLHFSFSDTPLPTPEEVRQWFEEGRYRVFAEVAIQYDGVSPSDERFEPYLAVAEELDVPVGIHMGPGPPGSPYLPGSPDYRGRLHSPLHLEEALVRHPRLRVYVMHAGWPMLDDLLALMYSHPRVYAGVGVISFILPRAEFHRYLRRIVEAGFGNRVLFGSDQMSWPAAIEVAVESIESADFLSAEQKRDILFRNAARFLRLDEKEIEAMRSGAPLPGE